MKSRVRVAVVLALALAAWTRAGLAAPVAESIGEGMVRFHASPEARRSARPSVALFGAWPGLGEAPADFPLAPEFRMVQNRYAASLSVPEGTSLYGTGMAGGPLLRNGRAVTCWNYDAYGYDSESPQLYQSHPWVLGVRGDGSAFGVLFDTTYRARIDLTRNILCIADGPPFPVIVVDRDSPQRVVEALADLTGHMPLPPQWALGYQQCRYSYTPDARVRRIASEFRARDIPCDVIWMDIDYMDGFRSFTFSPAAFPDPEGLNRDLHAQGFHSVWMIDPGIKAEPGYAIYDSGTRAEAWVATQWGAPFTGSVWPGPCVFPDFTSAAVRSWWGALYREFLAMGVDGVWNDMNEPAVFHVGSKTMPLENRHRADPDLGGPDTHDRYHNIYGMQMARGTRDGILAARPGLRPFVLSRANHLGGQRYAAAWTGDNTASWEHLAISIPMVLNLGLSGQPFAGPDIGGFAGDGDGEMFARWMGFGALLPFARGHTEKGAIDKEPWAFGPRVETTCRSALARRYRLMPYLYTLFREAAETGLPVARPLFFADPRDPSLRAVDDAFLLGGDLLVAAAVTPNGSRKTTSLERSWRRFLLDPAEAKDADLPALFLRPGAIVCAGPAVEFVGERPLDPLTLLVALDAEGRAEGYLYEDAGDGFGYREGAYRLTRYAASLEGGALRVRGTVVEGGWPPAGRSVRVRVFLDGREVQGTGVEPGLIRVALP